MKEAEIINFINLKHYGEVPIFCYILKMKNNDIFHLTSNSNNLIINLYGSEIEFDSKFCLKIESASFNESSNNQIILKGFYDENNKDIFNQIRNTEYIDIILYYEKNNYFRYWVRYFVRVFEISDLSFRIFLSPISSLLNQNIVNCFSKSCRASFGDNKCGINKMNFSKEVSVSHVDKNKIFIKNQLIDGYFKDGEIIFNSSMIYNIRDNTDDMIEIDNSDNNILSFTSAILVPNCDKSIFTCSKKYNNAINFRGEPYVPIRNLLKSKD